MAKQSKTRSVSEQQVRAYLEKAGEFLRRSLASLAEEDFNAAGLLAVHAAISANDAVTGQHGHKRSAGEEHQKAADLLREVAPIGAREWHLQANRLNRIVGKKNLVAYEGRLISSKEATWLVEQAERFVNWAKEVVPI
jgi:hypothetical protein